MTSDYEKTLASSFTKLDPAVYRSIALIAAIAVAAINMTFGGTWQAVLVVGVIVCLLIVLLPANAPRNPLHRLALKTLLALRSLPQRAQFAAAISFVGTNIVFSYYEPTFSLGRNFNLFLLPILFASLFFGPRIGAVALLASILAAFYCVIPPQFSFVLNSRRDFAYVIVFAYLGAIAWAIPVLIFESSVATGGAISERNRAHTERNSHS
jgi:K+-sensing histidine kinase KdpD